MNQNGFIESTLTRGPKAPEFTIRQDERGWWGIWGHEKKRWYVRPTEGVLASDLSKKLPQVKALTEPPKKERGRNKA